MAKRKKSKNKPQSEDLIEVPATESAATAAPTSAEPEPSADVPPVAEEAQASVGAPLPDDVAVDPSSDPVNLESVSVVATEVAAATAAVEDVAGADGAEAAAAEVAAEVEQKETANTDEGDAAGDATGDATSAAAGETPGNVAGEAPGDATGDATIEASRIESIIESLLFASDKALGLAELKRLLGERDGKKVTAAVQSLAERRKGTGIEVAALSSGWHLRTNPDNANWVSKLLVGRPLRLSRAMLETLAIVAYRQPVTRPEVDNIRGVDCGPVLKTLLERGLVRIIGKKEEVGRPMLYGTTPEFLRVFNLPDLSELPTLREFYDLSSEDQSRVDSEHGAAPEAPTPSATTAKPEVALHSVSRADMPSEPDDSDPLLDELDQASKLAKQVLGEADEPAVEESKTPVAQEPAPESIPPVAE
jgi:segregation and condensation protein B